MITKEAINKDGFLKPINYTGSARIAFKAILDKLILIGRNNILMPAYIGETDKEGSGVFDPIRQSQINYDFYKIKDDLSVDYNNLKEKISTGKYQCLLIIHYFGFIQNDMDKILDLCKQNDILLIEDCAHTFTSQYENTKVGNFGDFAFFSIHKIIPTNNGGILKNNFDKSIIFDFSFDDKISNNDLNLLAKSDLKVVYTKRQENYRCYLSKWQKNSLIIPVYNKLPDGIVPLNFPIFVKNGMREKIYFDLIDRGVITCSLYYRMINEINKDEFPESFQISDMMLNLPVHQDTNTTDIKYIIQQIKELTIDYIDD
ncbi:MAG: DegT/DnrJ/EryC1/StrS family aminotransferase [Bacteroidales bacterium]|nr:DegT/DnrJ/EryC1/StrS family aminotransferase [Bacteroidales bacterium]